jgi:hypothetical protein
VAAQNYESKYGALEERILRTLDTLLKAQTKDVVTFLSKEANQIANEGYENGIIDNNQMKELIKRLSPRRETVARKLSELLARNLVGKDGISYFIKDNAKYDARYFPSTFGAVCLKSLFRDHFPMIDYLGNNLARLILMFGVYVVYCFIEAARPADFYNSKVALSMTRSERDELTLCYIRQVFDPLLMYKYFLAALKNQPKDIVVEQHRQHLHKDEWFGLPVFDIEYAKKMDMLTEVLSTSDFADDAISNETNKLQYYRVNKDPDRPYELDETMVTNMIKVLGLFYPDIFKRIKDIPSHLWKASARSSGGTYMDDNKIRPPKETLLLGRKRRKKASKDG